MGHSSFPNVRIFLLFFVLLSQFEVIYFSLYDTWSHTPSSHGRHLPLRSYSHPSLNAGKSDQSESGNLVLFEGKTTNMNPVSSRKHSATSPANVTVGWFLQDTMQKT